MNMNVYKGFGWFDMSVEVCGKAVGDDSKRLAEIIVKYNNPCGKIVVCAQSNDLFAPVVDETELEALVRKACVIATARCKQWMKWYYCFKCERANGGFAVSVCKRGCW